MGRRAKGFRAYERRDRDEALLHALQKRSFRYFAARVDGKTGLVRDSTQPQSPASIAAVGFALSCYPVAIERGFMTRAQALAHTLAALRFFDGADQSGASDGTGYRGFFYHFLDPSTGRRAWSSELSTIDTALLVAGMLVAAQYFTGDGALEREVRDRSAAIYARVDFRWAQNGEDSLVLAWKPESGFSRYRWLGYNEALLLYVLALAAPEHMVQAAAYAAWTSTFKWKRVYGHEYVYAGPLFIHQFSHIWIDLRGIQDEYMAAKKTDYFENSRRAVYVQQEYARRNPGGFDGYDEFSWGLTASDGPGRFEADVHGRRRQFYGYLARGAPFGPDDGTLSPWAAVASLPFAPDLVLPAIRHFQEKLNHKPSSLGFYASFNPSFRSSDHAKKGWVSAWHYALNQGPIVAMIENYRSGLIWRLMRACGPIRLGLTRAGFRDGWLEA